MIGEQQQPRSRDQQTGASGALVRHRVNATAPAPNIQAAVPTMYNTPIIGPLNRPLTARRAPVCSAALRIDR
jgi:hypothetical protein